MGEFTDMSTLYILRGVPGSGKSTFVRNNLQGKNFRVFSTDDRFTNYDQEWKEMIETKDFSRLGEYHRKNLDLATEAMQMGVENVVIDNTNLTPWEPKPYVEAGLKYGYEIEFVNIPVSGTPEELAERNVHNVPLASIERMIKKYEQYPTLTVDQVLNSTRPERA
jgi:predicted kinase